MHWLVAVMCWAVVVAAVAYAAGRLLAAGLLARAARWLRCSREEKARLTRSGIYHANGFVIKNDADDFIGENYHRFDSVDTEYSMPAMSTMSMFPVTQTEASIPPQPLRLAPITLPQEPKSPKLFDENPATFNIDDQNKTDSFYLYNITTAITRSLISTDMTKEMNYDNSGSSKDAKQSIYTPIENMESSFVCDVNDQNDWNTRNNLNIFKKPDYKSTNPFLTNGNEMNCQFNPFYSNENSFFQSTFSGLPLRNESRSRSNSELTKCDMKADNMQEPKRFNFWRKSSLDSECQSEDFPSSSSGFSGAVRRAVSCDSVSSDTSLGPLESPLPIVTGQLCLSLRCFRINANDSLLAVNVIEARNLPGEAPDTFVGIFLSPDNQGGHFKSKVCRKSNCPSYNETFLVDIGKSNKKLSFHIYSTENETFSLIGEADLSLQDAGSYKQPVTTWLTLTDSGQGTVPYGELLLSLSYLPTAERLTLILARARRLPNPMDSNVFIKVYLQRNGKKVAKKRSSIKNSETCPTFNEAFIFSVPPHLLSSVELRVTLVYYPLGVEFHHVTQHYKIGHILLGRTAAGKPGSHWGQMVSSLRKPVSMWHPLRKQHSL